MAGRRKERQTDGQWMHASMDDGRRNGWMDGWVKNGWREEREGGRGEGRVDEQTGRQATG